MEQSLSRQYLSFSLDGERYAVRIEKVHEVLEYTRITNLPRMANFMKGIINLRGRGIPVLDLRLKFGMLGTPIFKDTAIIVLEIMNDDTATVVGAMADAVHGVIELTDSAIEPPPRLGSKDEARHILGIGKQDDGFVVVLDLDGIFKAEEHRVLAKLDGGALSDGFIVGTEG